MDIKINQPAPKFSALDQTGQAHKLTDYLGQWLLLYFYPKDDTPGCTKEACDIRDRFKEFAAAKLAVIGLSPDSVESHGKFAEKYKLPFTLLADEDKKIVKAYGVWAKKTFMGKEYMGTKRTSFLINPQGIIAAIYENVKPDEHAAKILRDITKLK